MSPFFRKCPSTDPTSIGNILKDMGVINDKVLLQALNELKKNEDLALGEMLVQMENCTTEQRDFALAKQKAMRGKLPHKDAVNIVGRAVEKSKGVVQGIDELGLLARTAAKNGSP